MKILLVGSFQYNIYSPAFEKGFNALGCTVDYVDTNAYFNKGLGSSFLNKVLAKYHIGLPLLKLNRDINIKVRSFDPDFVFFYNCMDVFTSTYKKIKAQGITFFTYTNDDPFSKILNKPWCQLFHRSLPLADWNFVYRKKNIEDYNGIGVHKVGLLLPYYIVINNYPMNLPRTIPMSFMGHWEDDGRDEYVKELIDAKLPFIIFGDDSTWSRSSLYNRLKNDSILEPRKIGEEYNRTINRLQVAIIFLSKLNHDTYTRRCFEIPITKTCMLCEYTDDMNEMFPDNECAVYFRNPKEFREKAAWLLNNPEECKKIGENSFERLKVIGGSEIDRCEEIVSKYTELKKLEE